MLPTPERSPTCGSLAIAGLLILLPWPDGAVAAEMPGEVGSSEVGYAGFGPAGFTGPGAVDPLVLLNPAQLRISTALYWE